MLISAAPPRSASVPSAEPPPPPRNSDAVPRKPVPPPPVTLLPTLVRLLRRPPPPPPPPPSRTDRKLRTSCVDRKSAIDRSSEFVKLLNRSDALVSWPVKTLKKKSESAEVIDF